MPPPLDLKLADWTRTRRRRELETRLLVVDDEQAIRRHLDDLLYRLRVSSRSVTSTEQAMELLASGSYPLLLVAENLSGMGGLYLIRQIRQAHPAVDALLTSWDPSLELLARAFDLRLLDVLRKPLPERQAFGELIRAAIRRNVDRRMRRFLVQELHASLEELPEEVRAATTHLLEARLNVFKASLGAFDRVLVIEGDDSDLRLLSESLLLQGLHVEVALSLQEALARARDSEAHLVIARCSGDEAEMRGLLVELRGTNPVLEVLLVSRHPEVELARTALLLEAAGYFSWPPTSVSALANRVPTILKRARRERLLDNLVVELFRETSRAFGTSAGADSFPRFCRLIGLTRVAPEPSGPLVHAVTGEAVEYLDDVLDTLLAPEEQLPDTEVVDEPDAASADAGSNRRIYQRVAESQFVRFRSIGDPASTLAMVGDLSEGGLFIRTGELHGSGTQLELEFQVVLSGLLPRAGRLGGARQPAVATRPGVRCQVHRCAVRGGRAAAADRRRAHARRRALDHSRATEAGVGEDVLALGASRREQLGGHHQLVAAEEQAQPLLGTVPHAAATDRAQHARAQRGVIAHPRSAAAVAHAHALAIAAVILGVAGEVDGVVAAVDSVLCAHRFLQGLRPLYYLWAKVRKRPTAPRLRLFFGEFFVVR